MKLLRRAALGGACAVIAVLAFGGAPARASAPNGGQIITTLGTNENPQDVAVSADGHWAYVVTLDAKTIDVFDLETLSVSHVIQMAAPVGSVGTFDDGSAILATNDTAGLVSVVDAGSETVTSTIATGSYPTAIATIPGTHRFLTSNNGSNTVTFTDLDAGTSKNIPVGAGPWGVAVSHGGDFAYVVLQGANAVAVVDLASLKVTRTIAVGARPAYIAVGADDSELFVTEADGGTVARVDIASGGVVSRYTVGGRPWGLSVSPDGHFLYAADNANDSVTSIDLSSGRTLASSPTGERPDYVATAQNGTLVLVVNSDSNSVTVMGGYSDASTAATGSAGDGTASGDEGEAQGGTGEFGGYESASAEGVAVAAAASAGSTLAIGGTFLLGALAAIILSLRARMVPTAQPFAAPVAEPYAYAPPTAPLAPAGPANAVVTCSNCGAPVDDRFCAECGTPVAASAPGAQTAPVAAGAPAAAPGDPAPVGPVSLTKG